MRGFFKKLVFIVSLSVLISNIGTMPVVSAAAVPALKYPSKVIYIGGDTLGKYIDNCWIPSKNNQGYKVSYEITSGKNLITVSSNGKITATGNGVGAAVVTVTYSKSGEKSIIDKFTAKVRRNAIAVKLTNASKDKLNTAIQIGDKVTFQAAKTYDGSYAKGHYGLDNYRGVINDNLELVSLTPEIATVKGLTLTAVSAGTAKFIVIAKQYGENAATGIQSEIYSLAVAEPVIPLKQITTTTFELKMNQTYTSAPASNNFTFKKDETGTVIDIKSVTVDSIDKTKLIIETFAALNDGKTYKLTYAGVEYPITASNNIVADLSIYPSKIPAGTPTTVYLQCLDANGVVLNRYTLEDYFNSQCIELSVPSIEGYTSLDKFWLEKENSKAIIKAIYHTYAIDSSGNETGIITKEFLLLATKQGEITVAPYQYTIAKSMPDYSTLTEANRNLNLSVWEMDYKFYFYVEDSVGTDRSGEYSFEVTNRDALMIDSPQTTSKGTASAIYAISAAYPSVLIIVKKDGVPIDTIPVTIRAAKTLSSIDIDIRTMTLTSKISEKTAVTVTKRDQYGDKMDDEIPMVTLLNAPSTAMKTYVESHFSEYAKVELGKVIFDGIGLDAGTYQYQISIGNLKQIVSVMVVKPNENIASSYSLIVTPRTVDQTVLPSTASDKDVTIKVGEYKGSVLYNYLLISSVDVTHSDGVTKLYPYSTGAYEYTIHILNLGTSPVEKVKKGVYNIAVNAEGKQFSTSFTVTDNQTGLSAGRVKDTASPGSWLAALQDTFDFIYEGRDVEDYITYVTYTGVYGGVAINDTTPASSNVGAGFYSIQSVTINVPLSATLTVPITVDLNKTITVK